MSKAIRGKSPRGSARPPERVHCAGCGRKIAGYPGAFCGVCTGHAVDASDHETFGPEDHYGS